MKRIRVPALLVLLLAGFLSGRALRPEAAGETETFPDGARSPVKRQASEIPEWRSSSDSLDDLAGSPEDRFYGRAAHWLMDASSEEIAEFWNRFSGLEMGSGELRWLAMMAWTRADPEGALSAVRGTEEENTAWRAWACHDPVAALAAAATAAEVEAVAAGIGLHRPGWLREHAGELDEDVLRMAAWQLRSHPSDRPEDDLDLVQRFSPGTGVSLGLFGSFASEDPWAARRWLDGQRFKTDFEEKLHWECWIDFLGGVSVATARTMIDSMPDGRLKRKADLEWFERQLAADPDAVIAGLEESADALGPVSAAMRKAVAGKHLLEIDPEAAFAIIDEMFRDPTVDPASMSKHPNGSDNEVSDVLDDFVSRLMLLDPGRTLELLLLVEVRGSRTFNTASMDWAFRDPDGVAAWLDGIDNPEILETVGADVVRSMTLNSRFGDAMEWAMAKDADQGGQSFSRGALQDWSRKDPDGARAWVEGLPEDQRAQMEPLLPGSR